MFPSHEKNQETLSYFLNVLCSGENAFCSGNCRDHKILIEEEEESSTAISSLSSVGSSSSLNEDIFMAGMVMVAGPVDRNFHQHHHHRNFHQHHHHQFAGFACSFSAVEKFGGIGRSIEDWK